MSSEKSLSESEAIEILVRDRFPLADLSNLFRAGGNNQELNFSKRYEEAKEQAESYRVELRLLPFETLNDMVEVRRKAIVAALATRQRQQEEQRPFNQTLCKADFRHWSKMSFWTEDELTALLLDRDPRKVNWESVSPHIQVSPFAQSYRDLRSIVQRAVGTNQIWSQTIPTLALAWAKRMQIDVPANLISEVEGLGHQISDWKSLFDDQFAYSQKQKYDYEEASERYKAEIARLTQESARLKAQLEALHHASPVAKAELGTRQRETMLKVLIGMAIGGYGYVPSASRSPTAGEISSDLQSHGISISDDTIRSYLNEAKDLLSR